MKSWSATVAVRTLWPESIIANRYSFQDATKMKMRDHARHGERQDHVPDCPQAAGAVDLRRLVSLGGAGVA
jgi:hypothetical protein